MLIEKLFWLTLFISPGFVLTFALNFRPPKVTWLETVLVGIIISLTIQVTLVVIQTAILGKIDVQILHSTIFLSDSVVFLYASFSIFIRALKLIKHGKSHLHR